MYQVSILFILVWRRWTESSLLLFSRFQSFLVSFTGIYFLQVRMVQVRLVQCRCILSTYWLYHAVGWWWSCIVLYAATWVILTRALLKSSWSHYSTSLGHARAAKSYTRYSSLCVLWF